MSLTDTRKGLYDKYFALSMRELEEDISLPELDNKLG